MSIEQLFAELVTFTQELSEEEQRYLRENVSEEELAVFHILTGPGPDLTSVETATRSVICVRIPTAIPRNSMSACQS